MPARFVDGSLLLVLAHPGHELRVHGLLGRLRPTVLVLTDGSGRAGPSRIGRTLSIVEGAGAQPGPVFGRMRDAALYATLLSGSHEPFLRLAAEIASAIEASGAAAVAADAAEGFDPAHDVCRLLVNAAVARRRAAGQAVASYEFLVDGPPAPGAAGEPDAVSLFLDDAELTRKLADARAYEELSADVESTIDRWGVEAFRTETLLPVRYGFDLSGRIGSPPFYETDGERRVAEGVYREVLRFRRHVEPLAHALRADAEEAALAASRVPDGLEPLG